MSNEALQRVLEATGYAFADGEPAPGVLIGEAASRVRRGRRFAPDAVWRGPTATTVYFKFASERPNDETLSEWHREIWNEGFAPLLWLISPQRIELYNGFSRPRSRKDVDRHLLRTFESIEQQLVELDHLAGRLAMETGQFWLNTEVVNRKTTVDEQLLSDLAGLESDLVADGLDQGAAQGLIGRSIFSQYLIDREIVSSDRLKQECGAGALPAALRDEQAARLLFTWLAEVFNGDMFPKSEDGGFIRSSHLARVADFLEAVDPRTGQLTFFPYQFDVIPVELISSIYEQFAHSKTAKNDDGDTNPPAAAGSEARRRGVHYTRLPIVSLILDEVMADAKGKETVLDLTCGSGVFLVEAFRRLVERETGGAVPPRAVIRSILYNQVFGVDISEAAVRVAAFSLYLAALELDPNPQPPEALTFEKLIGKSLLIGDARNIDRQPEGAPLLAADGSQRVFDIIVGNPPWTFRGKDGTKERRSRQDAQQPLQPRGEGLDFVLRASDFGDETTKYGIVLSAMPFFSGSKTGAQAARYVVERLSPATIVNLAPMTKWMFPTAKMPAVVLFARHRPTASPHHVTVVDVPFSPSAEKSFTFEIAPSDVKVMPIADWRAEPERLKSVMLGRSRDLALLDDLKRAFDPLSAWLDGIGSVWRDGLILGKPPQRNRKAGDLKGLPYLETKDLEPFKIPSSLPPFEPDTAQWPRSRETYRAPLLLVKEFFKAGPRPVTAVAETDLVYTDAYFGASVGKDNLESARLVAAILESSLASWFILLTAAEFGIWKRRLLTNDLGLLPLPDPKAALATRAGQRILDLEAAFRTKTILPADLQALDDAVFDLYGIDEADRLVVHDGFLRAGWQWAEGRNAASQPASINEDMVQYAQTFAKGMDAWLQAAKLRNIRAEVFDLPYSSPLRVVRFVLRKGLRAPEVTVTRADGGINDVLDRIGRKLQVRLGDALVGERELRVHGQDEVVIIKPSARRFWMRGTALEDVDAVVAESVSGAAA